MKYMYFVVSAIGLVGCMANNSLEYDSVASNNLYHIARIRKGMSEGQVVRIMHKPYSYETFEVGEDVYDVWFYVTRTTGLDQTRMVPQNLTPLTFKNGILVGTGYYWYYYVMKEQTDQAAAEAGPVEPRKTQDQEDKEFEDALKPYPDQTTQAASSVKIKAPLAKIDLSKARIGMTETEVTNILGSPTSLESYQVGQDVYDVWFYEDKSKPLTFKNGVLVAKTPSYYNKIKKASKSTQVNGYDQRGEQMEEGESEQNFDYW